MIDYIINYMEKYCRFEWKVECIKERMYLTITCQLFEGQFEKIVLIHDPTISQLDENMFAIVYRFDSQKGIIKGELTLFLDHLRLCMQHVNRQILEGEQPCFNWQSHMFSNRLKTYRSVVRLDEQYLIYQ